MTSYFEGLWNRGATPALMAAWSFSHARHRVIAENIANMSTPDYKAKRLDPAEFQRTLREALDRKGDDPRRRLVIEGSDQFATDRRGRLVATPVERPGSNLMFHDGTNMSIETEMSELASNAMLHEMTTQLLAERFEGLKKAIRGQV